MIRALLIALTLTGVASALEAPERADPYTLVLAKLAEGERCFVLAADLSPVSTVATKDNNLVFTGPPGRYALLAFTKDATSQKIVTIGNPPPPVPPTPPNPPGPVPPGPIDGLAADVATQAALVNKPAACTALATVYESVVAKMRAGELVTIQAGIAELQRQSKQHIGPEWDAFGRWLQQDPRTKVGTRADMVNVCDQIAKGLRAAAGRT